MPVLLLNAYAARLPALTAEEALLTVERVAAGSGTLRRGVARQLISTWQRAADRQRIVIRPKSRDEYRAQMAMQGLAVRLVKPEPPDA